LGFLSWDGEMGIGEWKCIEAFLGDPRFTATRNGGVVVASTVSRSLQPSIPTHKYDLDRELAESVYVIWSTVEVAPLQTLNPRRSEGNTERIEASGTADIQVPNGRVRLSNDGDLVDAPLITVPGLPAAIAMNPT
jgi:hypothetical protein